MFQEPKLTVLKFAVEDVITVSGNGAGNGGVVLPDDEEGFE